MQIRSPRDFVKNVNANCGLLLWSNRDARDQQFMERPELIGQPQSHGRRSLVMAMHAIPSRQPQSPMSSLEVVVEQLQAHERLLGDISFGECVRLAGENNEPIAQGAVESWLSLAALFSRYYSCLVKNS